MQLDAPEGRALALAVLRKFREAVIRMEELEVRSRQEEFEVRSRLPKELEEDVEVQRHELVKELLQANHEIPNALVQACTMESEATLSLDLEEDVDVQRHELLQANEEIPKACTMESKYLEVVGSMFNLMEIRK